MLLKGDPRWRYRRRLVHLTVLFATLMIAFGAFVWRDAIVASELVRNGTILLTTILTGYVFAATWDDKGRTNDDPSASDFDT